MTLLIFLALTIGLLLGLLGGGGSILTVPVLVYLVGLEPKSAIATSLMVVGVTSLVAMIHHARARRVCWKTGFVFGLAGMLGAYGGGRVAAYLPGHLILLLFAVVMLGTALAMMRGRRGGGAEASVSGLRICPVYLPVLVILSDGLLVGAVTGLVGVGGGFVIVPALNLLGGLPMHAAVGTSLLVIAMQSFAALAGYSSHVAIDPHLVGIVTGAAVVGALLGGMLSHRISAGLLRRGFGAFVAAIACYLFYRELSWDLLDEARVLLGEHADFFLGLLTAVSFMMLYRLWSWIHVREMRRGEVR